MTAATDILVFARFDANGIPTAFYSTDIWDQAKIPTDVTPITNAQRQEFLNNPGQRKWDGSNVVVYTAPPAPVLVPSSLSRAQFYSQLVTQSIITKDEARAAVSGQALPTVLQNLINALSEDQQFTVEMKLLGGTSVDRANPFTEVLGESFGWTAAQIDQFFIDAIKL